MISPTHTRVDPGTVVVHLFHTFSTYKSINPLKTKKSIKNFKLTLATVVRPWRLVALANNAVLQELLFRRVLERQKPTEINISF